MGCPRLGDTGGTTSPFALSGVCDRVASQVVCVESDGSGK